MMCVSCATVSVLPTDCQRGHVRRDAALAVQAVALGASKLDEDVRAGGDGRVDTCRARRGGDRADGLGAIGVVTGPEPDQRRERDKQQHDSHDDPYEVRSSHQQ